MNGSGAVGRGSGSAVGGGAEDAEGDVAGGAPPPVDPPLVAGAGCVPPLRTAGRAAVAGVAGAGAGAPPAIAPAGGAAADVVSGSVRLSSVGSASCFVTQGMPRGGRVARPTPL